MKNKYKKPYIKKMINWKQAVYKKDVYDNQNKKEYYQKREIFKEYLKKNNLKYSGDKHQDNNYNGVSLFNDKTILTFSMRGFGKLMSEIYGGTYLDYYLD